MPQISDFIHSTIYFCILIFVYKLWKFLYHYFIGYAFGHTPDLKSFGKWCVVTGCTSGIGKSYAHAFAKLGLDMVLISRDPKKLKETEKDLMEKYGVKVKTITADFSSVADETFHTIKEALKDLDIGVLVNNAGILHQVNKFCDIPDIESEVKRLVNVNVTSHTIMTSIVLPRMAEKNRGLVLFISSLAAVAPSMCFQLYGSTKAYIDYLSRALNEEYGSEHLIIQSVLPGPVCTNMLRSDPSIVAISSEDYVKHQLKTVGIAPQSFGYYIHELLYLFSWLYFRVLMPKKISRKIRLRQLTKYKSTVFSYQFSN